MTKVDIASIILNTYDKKLLERIAQVINGASAKAQEESLELRTCTITEAAQRLNISRSTAYKLIERGAIKTVNLNGNRRVVVQSMVNYITQESK